MLARLCAHVDAQTSRIDSDLACVRRMQPACAQCGAELPVRYCLLPLTLVAPTSLLRAHQHYMPLSTVVCSVEDLRHAAEKYGRVRDVYIPRDFYTQCALWQRTSTLYKRLSLKACRLSYSFYKHSD